MRIFEAVIACSLILVAHYFLSYSTSSISTEKSDELETMAQNLLNLLQDQTLMMSVINGEQNWNSSIKAIVESILPPDILYNISMVSLYTGEVFASGITNIESIDDLTQDVVSVQGVYTFSFPLVQKTDVLLDVIMVMDRSGSMSWKIPGDPYQKIYYTKRAACNFIDRLNATTDRAGLTSFATDSTTDAVLTYNHQSVKDEINDLYPSGHTNMMGGINKANLEFQTHGRTNATWVMILLSDGKANWWDGHSGSEDEVQGARYALEKANVAKDMGVRIYTIGLGASDYLNETLLREIQTDGYFFSPSAQDLDRIYQTISEDLIYEVKYDVVLITITVVRP
jgi:hypothetical protein